jgi:hypothetical protein
VDHLYSLYDALVSIHVPNERARAVVDALERDMHTKLATKADLDHLRELLSKDMQLQVTTLGHQMTLRFGAILGGTAVLLGALQKLL